MIPILIDRGFSAVDAAGLAGALGISVVFGRIAIGFLIDKINAPFIARLVFALTGAGCVLLAIGSTPNWLIAISIMTMGLAAAAEVDLLAYLVGRFFGLKSYGKIYGWQITIFYAGAAVGPLVVGVGFDFLQGLCRNSVRKRSSDACECFYHRILGPPPEELQSEPI